jgi:hypothetical protein
VKNIILPKVIYRFSAISVQLPMTFLKEIEKPMLKFIWKHIRPQTHKVIPSKKNTVSGITIPDFTLHFRATVTKTGWHWQRSIQKNQ